MTVGAAAGKGIFSVIGIFKFLLSMKGAISITLIVLVIAGVNGIVQSKNEGNLVPFFRAWGNRLLNHDKELYRHAAEIEANGGVYVERIQGSWFDEVRNFFRYIGAVFPLISALWFMYVLGRIFYFFSQYIVNNSSLAMSRVVITIGALIILEIFAHFIVLDSPDAAPEFDMTTGEKFIPFRGVIKFAQVVPYLTNPNFVAPSSDNMTNSTNYTYVNESLDLDFGGF